MVDPAAGDPGAGRALSPGGNGSFSLWKCKDFGNTKKNGKAIVPNTIYGPTRITKNGNAKILEFNLLPI
jgi:hypothetical protein